MDGSLSDDKKASFINTPAQTDKVGALPVNNIKEPFEADRRDSIFALVTFILGFFFVRWVLLSWQGWGVTIFTLSYCSAITVYFVKKGVRITPTGYFWLGAVVLTGISYSFYENNGLEPIRSLFLFCSAVYYVICASGQLILGDTSNWLFLDGINGMFIIPFKNFGCQYKSLASSQHIKRSFGRQLLSVVLGLVLTLFVSGMVLPLLMQADSGGFSKIAKVIYENFRWVQNQFDDVIFNTLLAIPVAAYLFGLAAGCAHKRGCNTFKRDDIQYTVEAVQVLAPSTIYIMLGSICGLYLVFIGSQLPYFFSAFIGQRPEGWQIYSEYARKGFFELCQIAAINLFLLLFANVFCKKPQGENRLLKILNSMLSLLTLLLIATAFSKMALYIGAYGLSIRRLLPWLFMIFLAAVFGSIIVLQKRKFSIVRFSALIGALMICALSMLNPDGFVARYNAERFLSGTLEGFDVKILYQSGLAGVPPALKVYNQTDDQELKAKLRVYITDQQQKSTNALGTPKDSLQKMLVRQKAKSVVTGMD